MRSTRLSKFPQDYFRTLIVDEAHHSLADSYQNILQHFGAADVLGVTATPDRGDKKNLGQYYDRIAYEYSLYQGVFNWGIVSQTLHFPGKLEAVVKGGITATEKNDWEK